MKNKEKILIALGSLSFFLLVYFLIASKKIEMPKNNIVKNEAPKEQVAKVDLEKLKNNYEKSVKVVYEQLQKDAEGVDGKDIDVNNELETFKNKLVGLTVPEEYKIFHLSFILLIDNVLNNNLVLDENFQNELNKIGKDNPWLK